MKKLLIAIVTLLLFFASPVLSEDFIEFDFMEDDNTNIPEWFNYNPCCPNGMEMATLLHISNGRTLLCCLTMELDKNGQPVFDKDGNIKYKATYYLDGECD